MTPRISDILPSPVRAVGYLISCLRKRRVADLVDQLAKGGIKADDPVFRREEVLSFTVSVADALQKAHGREKLEALMSLYVHGVKTKNIVDCPDDYFELLEALSTLSNREIVALALCDGVLRKASEPRDGKATVDGSREAFRLVSERFEISQPAAEAILCGIQRTGLIQPFNQPQVIPLLLLSERYEKLKQYVLIEHGYQ